MSRYPGGARHTQGLAAQAAGFAKKSPWLSLRAITKTAAGLQTHLKPERPGATALPEAPCRSPSARSSVLLPQCSLFSLQPESFLQLAAS